MKTFCPECGFGVAVDEDGCCVSCGCDATGPAVDELPIKDDYDCRPSVSIWLKHGKIG